MKHVAILEADRRAGRAAPPSSDRRSADSPEPLGPVELGSASEAFDGTDAKNAKGGRQHIPPENLKPKIYHNAQSLTPEARRAPGRRESRSVGLRFSEAAHGGELKVKAGPGMTEASLAWNRAARAGSSFQEPLAWMVEDASCEG
jgi:D-alanine-D-alanine ligase